MRIKRGRHWMLGGVAVLAGLVVLQAFVSRHREPYLLERATRIAALKQNYEDHLWLSSHEVILISHSQKGILVDTATGRQQPENTGSKTMGERMGNAPQHDNWQQDTEMEYYLDENPMVPARLSPEKRHQVQAIQSHLPKPSVVEGFSTSPDCKQKAYLLQVWRHSILNAPDEFAQRFMLLPSTHPQSAFALYLSDPNGEHMREVAWEPIPESLLKPQFFVQGQIVPWPHSLRFTPDGKHVSFFHKGALWTVPLK